MSLRRPQLTHLHPSVHPSTATAPTVSQTQTSKEEAESALLDLLCLLNHPQAVLLSCDSVFCVSCMSEPCSRCIPEDQYDDSKAHLDVKPVDCWLTACLSLKYTQLFSMTQNEWLPHEHFRKVFTEVKGQRAVFHRRLSERKSSCSRHHLMAFRQSAGLGHSAQGSFSWELPA